MYENVNKNIERRFFYISDLTGISQYTLSDLNKDDRVIMIDKMEGKLDCQIIRQIRKIHISPRINARIHLPLQRVWKSSLRSIAWEHGIKYYIIFGGPYVRGIDVTYLKKIKDQFDVKYILYLSDLWNRKIVSGEARRFNQKIGFDYIFSFDPNDAEQHGFMCYELLPYSAFVQQSGEPPEKDIYLIASNSGGRLKTLHDIYESSLANNISSVFRITNVPIKKQLDLKKLNNTIIYNSPLSYDKVVKELLRSNCILELVSHGQTGATLRYYEAVCYNKKLLTNNTNVVNLPFYNPNYIHIFEKSEDIDWEWVKERIPVDYHYDGRFSPTHLIDRIIELEEEKERQQNAEKETS